MEEGNQASPLAAQLQQDRPIPSLQCLVGGKSKLLALGSIETRQPKNTWPTQTSMLYFLGFAETSNASEPIFAQGRGGPLLWSSAERGDSLRNLFFPLLCPTSPQKGVPVPKQGRRRNYAL